MEGTWQWWLLTPSHIFLLWFSLQLAKKKRMPNITMNPHIVDIRVSFSGCSQMALWRKAPLPSCVSAQCSSVKKRYKSYWVWAIRLLGAFLFYKQLEYNNYYITYNRFHYKNIILWEDLDRSGRKRTFGKFVFKEITLVTNY